METFFSSLITSWIRRADFFVVRLNCADRKMLLASSGDEGPRCGNTRRRTVVSLKCGLGKTELGGNDGAFAVSAYLAARSQRATAGGGAAKAPSIPSTPG